MVRGSWVGGPFTVSPYVSSFFPVCSSSPMSASITGVGVGGITPCALIPFFFALFFSFLCVGARRPRSVGILVFV